MWVVRCMEFSLTTAVICLISLSYLYWMLLGAWQASRRRMNEPWSTLNIIQPKHPGPAFQPYEYDGNELASSGNLADETRRFH
ncbi:unnamed protein product [Discula destructiva]